jgi:hypothetical protein
VWFTSGIVSCRHRPVTIQSGSSSNVKLRYCDLPMLTRDAATTVVYYGRDDAFMTSTQVPVLQQYTTIYTLRFTAGW